MKKFRLQYFAVIILLIGFKSVAGQTLFVSVEGDIKNKGTIESPIRFEEALKRAKNILKKKGLPEKGITINIRGGHYSFDKSYLIDKSFQGTKDSPIIIQAYKNEKVLFDGGKVIRAEGFAPVTDDTEVGRLSSSAKENIRVRTITDKELIAKLSSKVIMLLTIDGSIYLPSCYPNIGFAMLDTALTVEEITPPACPLYHHARAGNPPYQEEGKPAGWLGSLEEPRGAQAGIGEREEEMAGTWEQWEAELKRDNSRNLLSGFVDAHWLLRSFPLYAASGENKTMHLSNALAYGWSEINDKIFKVFGLLCELDQPGEWHFDTKTNRLFIYPPNTLDENTEIGLPFADGFLTLDKTSYVSVIGINVQNVGKGVIYNIKSGNNNLIAGCKVSNSTALGALINGKNNGVKSCDFVDLNGHAYLTGGVRSPTELTSGYNYIENCHFYQKSFKHEKVNIFLHGVGNIFKNNLVHNSIGQAMVVKGNDHLLELNEFFNIGFEEGDGGAVYSGADLAGYGNLYKHNFFHHLMNVPGKVQRAGLHLDDLQAGSICEGNIFYKSASKGIFMNAGAGHVLRHNINLEGSFGIYNVAFGSRRNYDMQEAILRTPNHDHLNTKENYVGNCEKYIGFHGWENNPWKTKYPRMHMVLSDTGEYGRMWPIRCVVEDNYFYGNTRGDSTVWSRFEPEARAKSILKNDIVVAPEDFVDYENFDFSFRKGKQSSIQIPFNSIGLYVDKYRTTVPDKQHYRLAIKAFFKDYKSEPGTVKQINTATIIENGPFIAE